MDQECGRLLDDGGAGVARPDRPSREQDGHRIGRRSHGEGRSGHCQRVCLKCAVGQPCASRSEAPAPASVPFRGRGTGADPVPPGHVSVQTTEKYPRVQADVAHRSQRPHRHRTGGLSLSSVAPDPIEYVTEQNLTGQTPARCSDCFCLARDPGLLLARRRVHLRLAALPRWQRCRSSSSSSSPRRRVLTRHHQLQAPR